VDPETRCATPTNVKVLANYNWVTCSLTPMSNVKEYCMEIYSEAIPASGDPDPEKLIDTMVIPASDFPITVKNVPAGTYYYRIQGRNEEAGLKASKWVKGSFTTTNYTWLDIEGCFDYSLASNSPKDADVSGIASGVKVDEGKTYEYGNVTYGPLCSYGGDGKWNFNRCKNFDTQSYAKPFPLESYVMIKITKPGTVSFIPRDTDTSVLPEVVFGLLATKGDKVTFEYIYQETLLKTDTIGSKNEENRIIVEVTEDHLYGISEPACLYLFTNLDQIIAYPFRWTRK